MQTTIAASWASIALIKMLCCILFDKQAWMCAAFVYQRCLQSMFLFRADRLQQYDVWFCLHSYIPCFGAKYSNITVFCRHAWASSLYCLLTKCSSPCVKTPMQNEYDIVCHSLLMVTHTALSGRVRWHRLFMTCIHACIITQFTAPPSDLEDNDQFKM